MSDFGNKVKGIWMKGMEAIGNTASSIASNTKYKVDEMNLVNKKREILSDISVKTYTLWQKGVSFPDTIEDMLRELSSIDEQLNDLRAERLAGVEAEEAERPDKAGSSETQEPSDACPDEEQQPAEGTAEPEPGQKQEIPVIKVPETKKQDAHEFPPEEKTEFSDKINELFKKTPSIDDMADKVNGVLDSLGDSLKKFSDGIDKGLDDLDEKIHRDQDPQ